MPVVKPDAYSDSTICSNINYIIDVICSWFLCELSDASVSITSAPTRSSFPGAF